MTTADAFGSAAAASIADTAVFTFERPNTLTRIATCSCSFTFGSSSIHAWNVAGSW